MKRAILVSLILCGCAAPYHGAAGNYNTVYPVTPDAYGLNVGAAATGEPVALRPAFGGYGGNFDGAYVQRPDAYGHGIHMDQFGRPVTWGGY